VGDFLSFIVAFIGGIVIGIVIGGLIGSAVGTVIVEAIGVVHRQFNRMAERHQSRAAP
jgi:gas vesicle protein